MINECNIIVIIYIVIQENNVLNITELFDLNYIFPEIGNIFDTVNDE